MNEAPGAVKTGTSTVGITFKGGVVVGADHRATMGHFVANKSVQKLFKIGDNLALNNRWSCRSRTISGKNISC